MAVGRKTGIPPARSGRWFILGAFEFVLFAAVLLTIRFAVLGQEFSLVLAFRFVLLSAALALVSAAAGWYGARWIGLGIAAGVLAGLIAMAFYSIRDADGWEELIGFLAFLELAAAGLILGVVAEWIALAIRRRRRGR